MVLKEVRRSWVHGGAVKWVHVERIWEAFLEEACCKVGWAVSKKILAFGQDGVAEKGSYCLGLSWLLALRDTYGPPPA